MELSSPSAAPPGQQLTTTPSRLLETQSSRNEDWNTVQRVVMSLFQQKAIGTQGPIDLYELNQKLVNLMKTEVAPFLGAYYQEQLLKRGMIVIREAVREETGQMLLDRLGEVWRRFFGSILPSLQAVFYPLTTSQTSSGMSIRNLTLLSFRDIILMKMPVKEALDIEGIVVPPTIRQMLLVLSMVREKDHPTDTYLKLEKMLASIVSPFIQMGHIQKRLQEDRARNSPKVDRGASGGSHTLPRNLSASNVSSERKQFTQSVDMEYASHLRGKTFSSPSTERGSFPLSAEQQSLRRKQGVSRRKPTTSRSALTSQKFDLDPVKEVRPSVNEDRPSNPAPDSTHNPYERGVDCDESSSSGEMKCSPPIASSAHSTSSPGSGPEPKTPVSVATGTSCDLESMEGSDPTLDNSVV